MAGKSKAVQKADRAPDGRKYEPPPPSCAKVLTVFLGTSVLAAALAFLVAVVQDQLVDQGEVHPNSGEAPDP